jgi:hypothetical protein
MNVCKIPPNIITPREPTPERLLKAIEGARAIYEQNHNPNDPRWARCDACACRRTR